MPPDWNASVYHQVSDPQFEWGLRVLGRLRLEGDERVLDVGCGTGRLTAEIARRLPVGRVVGADRSATMIAQAAQQLRGSAVRLVRADAARLPFTASFDVAFSTATFHWVRDHAALFSNIFAVLRPGGRLHAQCGGGPNLARLRSRANDLLRSARFAPSFAGGWQEPWFYATPEMTARTLRGCGFEEVDTSLQDAPVTFDSAGAFQKFVDHVCLHPYLNHLPGPLKAQFSDAIVRQAAEDTPEFTLDYWRLNINATRPPRLG